MERKQISAHWFLWVIIAASFLVTILLYNQLPEQMPTHWNIAGEVDRYDSRFVGAFSIPFLSLVILLMMIWLPAIDPRTKSYAKFEDFYKLFQWVMILFLTGLHGISMAWALGYQPNVPFFSKLGIGILFIVMGNYMGKTRSNWFFGLKTPWTLENEEVWIRTHRLAGTLMFSAGIITLLLAFVNHAFAFWAVLGLIMLASTIPFVYSYFLYQRLT